MLCRAVQGRVLKFKSRCDRHAEHIVHPEKAEHMSEEMLKKEIDRLKGELAARETLLRDIDDKLIRLSVTLSMFGADPQKNIDLIVESTCAIIGAAAALYNRLDDAQASLCTWSIFNEPPGYDREDAAEGHICYEATIKGEDKPVVLENLEGTEWEARDPNVKKFGLKSYLGFPVRHRGRVVGSLCLVDVKPRHFSRTDITILSALAKAMEIEEERKALEAELADKIQTIEEQRTRLSHF